MRIIAAAFGGAIALSGAATASLATPENGLHTALGEDAAVRPWILSSNLIVATNNGVVPKASSYVSLLPAQIPHAELQRPRPQTPMRMDVNRT